MYIVTVIPIKKGSFKENLSYFSATDIILGSIVTVPMRLKNIDAIVISVVDAREMKSDLKSADYQLRKIIKVKGFSPFSRDFFTACEKMAHYTVSNTGGIIKNLLPSVFLENIPELKVPDENIGEEKVTPTSTPTNASYGVPKHEKLIFQTTTEDRLAFYRTLIREAFAKKESIFICVPTRYDIEIFKDAMTRGIEEYVFCFHAEMPRKALISGYNEVVESPHPVLIIGTGIFMSIPRIDVKTIIIEHESEGSYKQQSRPYVDIRSFAEILSSIRKTKLIFGDTLLRPDTLHRHEAGKLDEVHPPFFRLPEVERKIVVDMKEELARDKQTKKEFSVLSETTRMMIEYALGHKESVFLYATRKGLAPVTVCHDCGHTLLCPECKIPIVLYSKNKNNIEKLDKEKSDRIFMCNKCGKKDTTNVRCPTCSSWNLTPLGIGTDRVHEEIKKLFPETNITQIDKEIIKTDKEAKGAIIKFNKSVGGILIGTEMVFSYLNKQVDHSAIISLDGLLSIPSFNITQKILHIIEKLHYITRHNLIIQTRIPDNQILGHILSGNVLPLYREDLKDREQYGYPPFKRLIKITFSGSKVDTEKARIFLNELLTEYDPQIFSAFISKVRNQYVTNTVIKIDPNIWPLPINEKSSIESDLIRKLYSLPPSFSINVDPEDLL